MNPNEQQQNRYQDRSGDSIVLANKFIRYRNRTIPYSEIKETRVKNNRLMLNHYVSNTSHPRMCILFHDSNQAQWFHDQLLEAMYYRN